jgi:hypothetical protein
MPPHYLPPELEKWGGETRSIRDGEGRSFGVKISKVEGNPEKIRILVSNNVKNYVYGEKSKKVIFYGESEILSRENFRVINGPTGNTMAKVIYLRPPINRK